MATAGRQHHYRVTSSAVPTGNATASAEGKPDIAVAPPREFGGPGDVWSPEDLLVASLGQCFTLSFRAVAEASKLGWQSLDCEVDGVLEKGEGGMQFTGFTITGTLVIDKAEDADKATKLLDKAEKLCFVSNSLIASCHQSVEVKIG